MSEGENPTFLKFGDRFFRLLFSPVKGIWILRGPFLSDQADEAFGHHLMSGRAGTTDEARAAARAWLQSVLDPDE